MAFYRGDVDRTLQAFGHLQDLFFGSFRQIEDLAGILEKCIAFSGQSETMGRALKQLRTQFVLQIADLAAQRGLCDQQFCC